jgi:HD-GYP domain-containing protein (c-di-GMP phosphodiesterase class II)/HAMP domain-containing protein
MSWISKRIKNAVNNGRLFPIRIYIGVMFIALILSVGFCIGLYNYVENTRMLMKMSTVLFDRARHETRLTVSNMFAPTQMLVNVLSQQPITRATTLAQRLDSLPSMIEALNQHAPLSALYVGYQNGDFFLVRQLRTEQERIDWTAPADARYVVQHVDRRRPAAPAGTYLFYDASARLLERRNQADYRFDPRVRPWYRLAQEASKTVATEPYVFFSTREPGITFTRRTADGRSVVGADITLAAVTQQLSQVKMSPSAELMLLDSRKNVVAYSNAGGASVVVEKDQLRLPRLDEFRNTVLAGLLQRPPTDQVDPFTYRRQPWIGFVDQFLLADSPLLLAIAAPRAELLQDAERVRRNQMLLTMLILLLSTPVAWLAGRWISRPLQQLAEHARLIQAFDFSQPIARTWIKEADQLALSMEGMKRTISHFLDLSASLSSAHKLPNLLEQVLVEAADALQASGGSIYLNDDGREESQLAVSHGQVPALPRSFALRAADADGAGSEPDFANWCRVALRSGVSQVSAWPEGRQTCLVIPLFNRERDAVGLIALFAPGAVASLSKQAIGFVEALSGTAAIAIEVQRSLEARKALLRSLIELIAAAIDAKSPYTGGHCQRVPVIAKMLAHAACDASNGPYRDFQLSEDEWEALHLGAWLHDCGKVTTPEYVVDKATKLEMLYDRIHEVRMRFEVLKRDADIAYWKGVAEGGDRARLADERALAWRTLDDDFAFIAQCNRGGEYMSPEQIERIKQIGQRVWVRTLDDRIGISIEELQRKTRTPAPALPVAEALLGDRDDHLVERLPQDNMPADNPWGFKLKVPQYKYNHGEIYNLSVSRGTLAEEERYKINDHVAQTYIMLSKLPLPRTLRAVPDIAGSHHETMDGSGFPRRLHREQMSAQMRMVAIADIFEALTAADRPYKGGKPLSEALDIMARMRNQHHIDAELFDLFLSGGVYRDYAQQYLKTEQIDVKDIARFLSAASSAA